MKMKYQKIVSVIAALCLILSSLTIVSAATETRVNLYENFNDAVIAETGSVKDYIGVPYVSNENGYWSHGASNHAQYVKYAIKDDPEQPGNRVLKAQKLTASSSILPTLARIDKVDVPQKPESFTVQYRFKVTELNTGGGAEIRLDNGTINQASIMKSGTDLALRVRNMSSGATTILTTLKYGVWYTYRCDATISGSNATTTFYIDGVQVGTSDVCNVAGLKNQYGTYWKLTGSTAAIYTIYFDDMLVDFPGAPTSKYTAADNDVFAPLEMTTANLFEPFKDAVIKNKVPYVEGVDDSWSIDSNSNATSVIEYQIADDPAKSGNKTLRVSKTADAYNGTTAFLPTLSHVDLKNVVQSPDNFSVFYKFRVESQISGNIIISNGQLNEIVLAHSTSTGGIAFGYRKGSSATTALTNLSYGTWYEYRCDVRVDGDTCYQDFYINDIKIGSATLTGADSTSSNPATTYISKNLANDSGVYWKTYGTITSKYTIYFDNIGVDFPGAAVSKYNEKTGNNVIENPIEVSELFFEQNGDKIEEYVMPGDVTANVSVTNYGDALKGQLISALYCGKALVDVEVKDIEISAGSWPYYPQELSSLMTGLKFDGAGSYKLKGFFWNDETLEPLTKDIEISRTSSEAVISSFVLPVNGTNYEGVINNETKTISVDIPVGVLPSDAKESWSYFDNSEDAFNSAISSVTPVVSAFGNVDKTEAQNFTSPVTYTVTSLDGTRSVDYTVTVYPVCIVRQEDFDATTLIKAKGKFESIFATANRRLLPMGADKGNGAWYSQGFTVNDDESISPDTIGTISFVTDPAGSGKGVMNLNKPAGKDGALGIRTYSGTVLHRNSERFVEKVSVYFDESCTGTSAKFVLPKFNIAFNRVNDNNATFKMSVTDSEGTQLIANNTVFESGKWYDFVIAGTHKDGKDILDVFVNGKYVESVSVNSNTGFDVHGESTAPIGMYIGSDVASAANVYYKNFELSYVQ